MVETFFTEKRIIKKIIIAIVFIFMFNFTFSYLGNNVVFAEVEAEGSASVTDTEDKQLEDGGGKLLLPIHALVLWIADACLELLQNSFYSQQDIMVRATSEDYSNFNVGALVFCVVAVVVVALATVYTCGAALGAAGTVSGAVAAAASGGAITAGFAAAGTVAGQIARRNNCCRSVNNSCCCGRRFIYSRYKRRL